MPERGVSAGRGAGSWIKPAAVVMIEVIGRHAGERDDAEDACGEPVASREETPGQHGEHDGECSRRCTVEIHRGRFFQPATARRRGRSKGAVAARLRTRYSA